MNRFLNILFLAAFRKHLYHQSGRTRSAAGRTRLTSNSSRSASRAIRRTTDRPVRMARAYTYRIGKFEISEQMIDKANALGGLGITKDTRGPDFPATSVTWYEAARFVNWLNAIDRPYAGVQVRRRGQLPVVA